MKTIFILFTLFFSLIIKAQDSSFCYNNGAITSHYDDEVISESAKPAQENSLILMPYVMKEKDVLQVMLEKNNTELNKLLKKMKRSEKMKRTGLAAIPTSVLGIMSLVAAKTADSSGSHNVQIGSGIGLLALSSICLSTSYCFKLQHLKNYKKAIAKYNQLYN